VVQDSMSYHQKEHILLTNLCKPLPFCVTGAKCSTESSTRCTINALLLATRVCRHSGMARVNKGSCSFSCHPQTYLQVEYAVCTFTPQPASSHIHFQFADVKVRARLNTDLTLQYVVNKIKIIIIYIALAI